MSPDPLVLVVLAAFIHATWNLLAKRAAEAGPSFVAAYNLVACIGYAPWVIWLLARGELSVSLPIALCILVSAVIHLGYSLSLQRGYQVAPLSVVYPVARGTGPMLSFLGAILLLGESPSAHGVLGLAAVVIGIGLIATQGRLAAFRQPDGLSGLRWGLLTGALIAGYTVNDAYGVKALGIQPVALDWFSNLLRFVMLAPLVLHRPNLARDKMRGRWPLAIAVGLLSPLSYILVLAALERGAALSVVAPARELSMMIGALFGMILLREPVGVWRIAGCVILTIGAALLGTAEA